MAEEYYTDVFDSCSEDSEEQEEEIVFSELEGELKDEEPQLAYRTNQQVPATTVRSSGIVWDTDYTSERLKEVLKPEVEDRSTRVFMMAPCINLPRSRGR